MFIVHVLPLLRHLVLISFSHLLPAGDLCLFFIFNFDSNLRECKKDGKQDFVMLLNPNLELVNFRFSICELVDIECLLMVIWVWDLQLIYGYGIPN